VFPTGTELYLVIRTQSLFRSAEVPFVLDGNDRKDSLAHEDKTLSTKLSRMTDIGSLRKAFNRFS
jgi:hypothetical protein